MRLLLNNQEKGINSIQDQLKDAVNDYEELVNSNSIK